MKFEGFNVWGSKLRQPKESSEFLKKEKLNNIVRTAEYVSDEIRKLILGEVPSIKGNKNV